MKFLCDQCKAKYQIADEKVVGKTVKMKCRKCGHMIEVRAAVTDAVEAPLNMTADIPTTRGPTPMPAQGAPAATSMATSLSRVPQPRRDSRDALAGAFTKNIREDEPSSRSLGLSPADEWYVAINGVPVGPVRISELRRKAAAGAVTEDSLCWQEGFEEWRPVRSVPELAQMVREALATGRVSLSQAPASTASPGMQDRRSSAPPRPQSRPSMPRASIPASSPAPVAVAASPLSPAARSNVVPFSGAARGPATAEKLLPDDDETVVGRNPSAAPQPVARAATPAPVAVAAVAAAAPAAFAPPTTPSFAPDPFASPASAASAQSAGAFAAGAPVSSPFTAPAPIASPGAASAVEASPFAAPAAPAFEAPPPRRQLSVGAMAMIAMFGLFGITTPVVLFLRPAANVVVAPAASVPAAGPSAAPSGPSTGTIAQSDIPPVDTTTPDPGAPANAPSSKNTGANAGGKTTAPAASSSGKAIDPSIAALLSGGPSNGPSSGTSSGSGNGTGSLTQDQIEAVVRSRSAQVKRSCWERGGSGKSNNTTVSLTIAGNGSVSSANATGNDPAMSACIEKAVKGWQFPASGGSTPVNIPFHFVAQ